jgi:hypothetical protein
MSQSAWRDTQTVFKLQEPETLGVVMHTLESGGGDSDGDSDGDGNGDSSSDGDGDDDARGAAERTHAEKYGLLGSMNLREKELTESREVEETMKREEKEEDERWNKDTLERRESSERTAREVNEPQEREARKKVLEEQEIAKQQLLREQEENLRDEGRRREEEVPLAQLRRQSSDEDHVEVQVVTGIKRISIRVKESGDGVFAPQAFARAPSVENSPFAKFKKSHRRSQAQEVFFDF